jgi:hypothetical protein
MWRLAPQKGRQSGELILIKKKKGIFARKFGQCRRLLAIFRLAQNKKNTGGKYACCTFFCHSETFN